jgi:ABC-type nitrate/sulfonate/bicarbonate transport system ATPase subunit
MTTAIDIGRAVRAYGPVTALARISLQIADSEVFTLPGPSGCGKTTLLRLIAGLRTLSAGEIRRFGQNIARLKPNHRPVHTVFRRFALVPHMTVLDIMGFALTMQGVDLPTRRARAGRMLKIVHLPAFADRFPAPLSGGRQPRVALARALAPAPMLLPDKPLSALASKLRQAMRVERKQLQEETGIASIFVTHDQEEPRQYRAAPDAGARRPPPHPFDPLPVGLHLVQREPRRLSGRYLQSCHGFRPAPGTAGPDQRARQPGRGADPGFALPWPPAMHPGPRAIAGAERQDSERPAELGQLRPRHRQGSAGVGRRGGGDELCRLHLGRDRGRALSGRGDQDQPREHPPPGITPGAFARACDAETPKLHDAIWTNLKQEPQPPRRPSNLAREEARRAR